MKRSCRQSDDTRPLVSYSHPMYDAVPSTLVLTFRLQFVTDCSHRLYGSCLYSHVSILVTTLAKSDAGVRLRTSAFGDRQFTSSQATGALYFFNGLVLNLSLMSLPASYYTWNKTNDCLEERDLENVEEFTILVIP